MTQEEEQFKDQGFFVHEYYSHIFQIKQNGIEDSPRYLRLYG